MNRCKPCQDRGNPKPNAAAPGSMCLECKLLKRPSAAGFVPGPPPSRARVMKR